MSQEVVRTFIAVELPRDVKAMLARLQIVLNKRIVAKIGAEAASKALKWVGPEGAHLTLKFLGYVPAAQLTTITETLHRALDDKQQIEIHIDGLGAFPNLQRPRVIWVGIGGQIAELTKIASQIDIALEQVGWPREERAFSPHITVARLRESINPDDRRKIGDTIGDGFDIKPVAMMVEAISLMRSELTRAGAIYSKVSTIALRRHT